MKKWKFTISKSVFENNLKELHLGTNRVICGGTGNDMERRLVSKIICF